MNELSLDKNYTINDLKKYASSMNITLDNLFTCINIVNKYNDKYKTINDVLLETKKYINVFPLNDILNYIYIFNDSEIILPTDINLSNDNVKGKLPLSKLSTGTLENTEELDKFLIVDLNNNIKIVDKDLINLNNIELSVDIEIDKENITKASSAKAVYSFTYSKNEIVNLIKQYISEIPLIDEVVEYKESITIQVGTLVIYNNILYLCKTKIENTTTWETDSVNTILINSLDIDFKNYYNKEEVDNKLNDKINNSQLDLLATKNELTNYYNKIESDKKYALKEDIKETDLSSYYNKTETNSLLENKSDINHNHDNIYIKSDKSIPINMGGTGTIDGFNFQNTMQAEDFFKNIEANKNITTQNFIDKILAKYDNKPFMICVVNVSNTYINDLPSDAQVSNRIIIIQEDRNQLNLILYKHYDLTKYEGCVYNNTFQGWLKIRNSDGTIPFECGGVVKKYTNTSGGWTETLLNTGEILLQGYSFNTTLTNGTKTVTLHKEIKSHLCCNPVYTTPQTQQLSCSLGTNSFTINGANDAVVLWHYSGILK